jgi:hypothetical protein
MSVLGVALVRRSRRTPSFAVQIEHRLYGLIRLTPMRSSRHMLTSAALPCELPPEIVIEGS